ncbi:MAG: hemerythrin domain-containing protein [Nitrospirota bacterium]|nr:hemerythrin domain-containing protein [Nitrospirota bacterium]
MDHKLDYRHSEIKNQDPIKTLKIEHLETVQRLEMIERSLQYLESSPSRTVMKRCKIEQSRLRTWVNELEGRLTLHFLMEEEGLFPTLSEYLGKEHGPIEVLLEEHTEIKAILSEWKDEVEVLSQSFFGSVRDACLKRVLALGDAVMSRLRLHISKENQIIFKISEVSLSEKEKNFVAQKLQYIEKNHLENK